MKETGPTCVLETPFSNTDATSNDSNMNNKSRNRQHKASSDNNRRPALTNLAFNRKQRGLLAACDHTGQVHIWKLGPQYTSKQPSEMSILEEMENNASDGGESLELD